MNKVRITHFACEEAGCYLLFAGESNDWLAVKEYLKKCSRGPLLGPWYVATYRWPNREKLGAWWVSHGMAPEVVGCFTNYYDKLFEVEEEKSEPEPVLSKMPVSLQEAFDVLRLSMSATLPEVKKSYRELAFKYHPDTGGDTYQMQILNAANSIVMNWLEGVR